MKFERPGFGARVGQLGYLLKNTFTIVARDGDIIVPVVQMSAMAALVVCLFFGGLFATGLDAGGKATWLFVFAVVFFVYKFFFYNKTELALSRLVFETAIGNDPDGNSVKKQLKGLGRQVWILSLLDMASAWIARQGGKDNLLNKVLIGGITEIWDLVNHFLLPAFAIDKLSMRDATAKLVDLKDNVPEALVGVFGIDIAGGVVRSIMAPAYMVGGLLGIVIGLFFGGGMPAGFSAGRLGELFPSMPAGLPIGPDTVFSWMPLFIVIFLCFLAHAVFARLVTAVKVIYFTLFYARIMHGDKLAPEIREELEGYLKLDEDIEDGMEGATGVA